MDKIAYGGHGLEAIQLSHLLALAGVGFEAGDLFAALGLNGNGHLVGVN